MDKVHNKSIWRDKGKRHAAATESLMGATPYRCEVEEVPEGGVLAERARPRVSGVRF